MVQNKVEKWWFICIVYQERFQRGQLLITSISHYEISSSRRNEKPQKIIKKWGTLKLPAKQTTLYAQKINTNDMKTKYIPSIREVLWEVVNLCLSSFVLTVNYVSFVSWWMIIYSCLKRKGHVPLSLQSWCCALLLHQFSLWFLSAYSHPFQSQIHGQSPGIRAMGRLQCLAHWRVGVVMLESWWWLFYQLLCS